jgi:hypothetical protein
MYQFRNERGIMKIYDTRTRKLYWLDRPQGVLEIVALLNEKAAEPRVQRMGGTCSACGGALQIGIYCRECGAFESAHH